MNLKSDLRSPYLHVWIVSRQAAATNGEHHTSRVASLGNLKPVNSPDSRLRVAAIGFLNPAPLMWDFEHAPLNSVLSERYTIENMSPSECAARLADGTADIGLIPIAALATTDGLRVMAGCTIASKERVRSLLLVRRAKTPLKAVRTVAADMASRTTIAYTRILFNKWENSQAQFQPMAADLDRMLEHADAAIIIGDPALMALEERSNRFERSGEELVYHDLAFEWRSLTGLPFVSAVWAAAPGCKLDDRVVEEFTQSRDHGMQNIDALVAEWSRRFPLPESTIRRYLTENIHYVLDEECIEGMKGFFRMAAEAGVLPPYEFSLEPAAVR